MMIYWERDEILKNLKLPDIPNVWVRGQDGYEYEVIPYDRDSGGDELYALHRQYTKADLRHLFRRRKVKESDGELRPIDLHDLWKLGLRDAAPHAFTPTNALDPVTGLNPKRKIHKRFPTEIKMRVLSEDAPSVKISRKFKG
jgi:hypothetical protein